MTDQPASPAEDAVTGPAAPTSEAGTTSLDGTVARGTRPDHDGGITRSTRLPEPTVAAVRRFAGWLARGSVGNDLLATLPYWEAFEHFPELMEQCFTIFLSNLELDRTGEPVNEDHAERRAAVWLYAFCTGTLPPTDAPLQPWELDSH